jgi:hypothetical protein
MKNYMAFCAYLDKYLLEGNMFPTRAVKENENTFTPDRSWGSVVGIETGCELDD